MSGALVSSVADVDFERDLADESLIAVVPYSATSRSSWATVGVTW